MIAYDPIYSYLLRDVQDYRIFLCAAMRAAARIDLRAVLEAIVLHLSLLLLSFLFFSCFFSFLIMGRKY